MVEQPGPVRQPRPSLGPNDDVAAIYLVWGVAHELTPRRAVALFLVGVAPGGHVHVRDVLAGSILWVTWPDVLVCAGAFTAVGGLFRLFRGPLTRISDDYDAAAGQGLNVVLWDFVFYALSGLVIAIAVRVSGVVLVFAFLIMPAAISAVFSSAWRTRLLAAWAAGAVASVLGLIFAYRLDFSMGPSVAVFLGLELALAGMWALRRSRSMLPRG
jgi:zinc/manganese transport system permease protein